MLYLSVSIWHSFGHVRFLYEDGGYRWYRICAADHWCVSAESFTAEMFLWGIHTSKSARWTLWYLELCLWKECFLFFTRNEVLVWKIQNCGHWMLEFVPGINWHNVYLHVLIYHVMCTTFGLWLMYTTLHWKLECNLYCELVLLMCNVLHAVLPTCESQREA